MTRLQRALTPVLASATIGMAAVPAVAEPPRVQDQVVPGELLVSFRHPPTGADLDALRRAVPAVRGWRTLVRPQALDAAGPGAAHPLRRLGVARVDGGADPEALAAIVRAQPGVAYAEPNGVWSEAYVPDDPWYAEQYGPRLCAFEGAWDLQRGHARVVLAVADSGLNWAHEDFAGAPWTNAFEVAGNGVDDDGNGYADDVRGWDFAYGDNDATDRRGHGSHVTGIAAARLGNTLGVAGCANVTVMPLQVFTDAGSGPWDALVQAIYYAVDNGAAAINYSGGGRTPSKAVEEAVNYATARGVPIVAPSGNGGSRTPFYPAAFEPVIAVGAVDSNGIVWNRSNVGDYLDVVAPGIDVYSCWSGGPGEYAFNTGTSMAAPHVAGLVALMLSRNGALTLAEVTDILRGTADDGGEAGFDILYGYGRINAARALAAVPPACRADWNRDGLADSDDVFEFLNAFLEGDGDFNGDGVTDGDDVAEFFTAYFDGC